MKTWSERDTVQSGRGLYLEVDRVPCAAIFLGGETLLIRMTYFCDEQRCETKTMEFETVEAAKLAAEMLT